MLSRIPVSDCLSVGVCLILCSSVWDAPLSDNTSLPVLSVFIIALYMISFIRSSSVFAPVDMCVSRWMFFIGEGNHFSKRCTGIAFF